MKRNRTEVQFGSIAASASARFRTAVSLHSHTMHSEEALAPIPRYVRHVPIVSRLFRLIEERYLAFAGRAFDYTRAFWTPPLPPQAALAAERSQIEEKLGLAALVSLTDHDNILTSARLSVLERERKLPVSLEWTIPRGRSFLHLGVHNLPPGRAEGLVRDLNAFTCEPAEARLVELLSALCEFKHTLVVLNHPMWDEPGIGAQAHLRMLQGFLSGYRPWIHALEINGLRPWAENQSVSGLAAEWGLPMVSGGDRHGSAPNTALNLTNASCFSEFVREIREDFQSTVLLTPEYDGPHGLRYLDCILDILREYPEMAGRSQWMDRAYVREPDGSVLPLSAFWDGDWGRAASLLLSFTSLVHSGPLRSAIRAALSACQERPAWGRSPRSVTS
ncbi:MAG: hypothetical protein ACE141_15020 [Bryobacteraceae bacterium]